MDAKFFPQAADMMRFLPETILTIAGTLLLLLEAFKKKDEDSRSMNSTLALIAIGVAMYGTVLAYQNPGTGFNGMIVSDGFAAFFRLVVLAVGLLTVLCSTSYLEREKSNTGEFYVLLLFSLAGQCLMAAASELIMVFIGLEISSIASYILAGYLRDDKRGNESALKYFLLGSFATAFLLYGVAWVYGMTGSTNLLEIRAAIEKGTPSMVMVSGAAGLMLVSGLKVGPSTASAVKNASPVPAILLAIPFLGELPGAGEVLGTALCVGGVLLLSGQAGGTGRDRFWRPVMVYPIAAMLFFAVDNVVRKAGVAQVSHPMLGAIVAGAAMTVFAVTAFLLSRSRFPRGQALKWFLITGAFQGVAYYFIITALASGSVAVVVPLYTSSPIWVVIGSRLFLGHLETLTPRVILGVLAVFTGIVVITLFGG